MRCLLFRPLGDYELEAKLLTISPGVQLCRIEFDAGVAVAQKLLVQRAADVRGRETNGFSIGALEQWVFSDAIDMSGGAAGDMQGHLAIWTVTEACEMLREALQQLRSLAELVNASGIEPAPSCEPQAPHVD